MSMSVSPSLKTDSSVKGQFPGDHTGAPSGPSGAPDPVKVNDNPPPMTPEKRIHDGLDIPHHEFLRHVEFNGHVYDLDNLAQLKAFKAAVEKSGGHFNGVEITALDGTTYSLLYADDATALSVDGKDGALNGHAQPTGSGATASAGSSNPPAELTDEEKKAKAAADHAKAETWVNRSPTDLMDDIRNGRVPDYVASDPAAMLTLQIKMQDYQRMWQMITDMVKLQHEMQMAIVRNFPKG